MLTTSFCIFCVADFQILAGCCSITTADADFLTCSPSRSLTHLSMVRIDSPRCAALVGLHVDVYAGLQAPQQVKVVCFTKVSNVAVATATSWDAS